MVALAGLGVVVGSRVTAGLNTIAANLTRADGADSRGGRFRFYSVAGRVADKPSADYELRVDGLVERPLSLSFADLQRLPQTTITKDVQCVTGWRVPDVEWSGVLLSELLADAGVDPAATAVEFGSFSWASTPSPSH